MIYKPTGKDILQLFIPAVLLLSCFGINAQGPVSRHVSITDVDSGWSGNSVNAVVFRKNSLVSFGDTQFISFYDAKGFVVLGKRKAGEKNWQLNKTGYTGNIKDAHNSISIMVDGEGYLHLAWDQHNNSLNYCKSKEPLSLEMSEKIKMTGIAENSVSYPEFYKMPGGDLMFLYRDGGSGRGNLVVNKYNIRTGQWSQLHNNLIDGERQRNAYWQACVDDKGIIHISWVWRESPDVASNHDMCYARSTDGGATWERSTGEKYNLPVTAATAEYALSILQKSELINQTSICTDGNGSPVIASYWREEHSSIPQYHIVYKKKGQWQVQDLGFRRTAFSLSGAGTKQIPVSRPQVVAWSKGKKTCVAMIFKDEERGSKVSVAWKKNINSKKKWKVIDLTLKPVGAWEPSYDTELWKKEHKLNLYLQYVKQADAEGVSDVLPQMVQVLEWKP
ncbi:MAG: BNR repeat-containing protein [Chitinophagaceae bacterium]|nr:BNR repeat-containing protein [Chitinophagaceae bacterium]